MTATILNVRLINIKLGIYHFNPGLFVSMVAIVVAYILFSLGQWQISRAEYKENLQEKIAQRQNLPVANLNQLPNSIDDRRYRPVSLEGTFDNSKQFLLDNRIVKGTVGYDVYTPFHTKDGVAILVNRGFVPQGKSREELPDITLLSRPVKITGLINKAPSKGIILADNLHSDAKWPVVLQYVDLNELSKMLNYQLMDMVLLLNKDENSALIYHLPVLNLNAAKNHGYAFQWFAMTLTVCLLYLFLNTSKTKEQKKSNISNEINGSK